MSITDYPFGLTLPPEVPQNGSATLVPADGSASPGGTAVSYGSSFATSTDQVTIGLRAYSGSDNAALSYRIVSTSVSGFSIVVTGGNVGTTVTVDYVAIGH